MWLIAGFYHEFLMAAFYGEEVHASHNGTGIILLGYFILGAIMTYLFPFIYKGEKPAYQGLKFGVVIGLLWVFPHELVMVGAHGESISYVLKNAAWHMVEQGVGGIVIASVYDRLS